MNQSWERNQVVLRMEDISAPLTEKQRVEMDAWKREQRRPLTRLRKTRRAVTARLRDTWQVARHGLPGPHDY